MAKKFFYNRVYNTKRTIINLIIIGVCIIGVIICFIVVSNFQGEDKTKQESNLSIKESSTIEVNESFTNEIFFSKIENFDLKDVDVTYPDDYDPSTPGTYDIILNINKKNYNTKLQVVDTIRPVLELKELTIAPNDKYEAKDFVKSCKDNSNKDCIISFYQNGTDEDANPIDYSAYTKEGTYPIKISAKDNASNETVIETKLIIKKGSTTTQPPAPKPTTCKYGDTTYDKENYLITKSVSTNGCAISLDLYKDAETTKEIDKIMESETIRIQKDVTALNLNSILSLNRKQTAVVNVSGSGIVGYELRFTVSIPDNGKTKTIVDYKLDADGRRVFITNPYNLAK